MHRRSFLTLLGSSAAAWPLAAAGTVRRFVCTIKFQGATDFASMEKFAAIPGCSSCTCTTTSTN